MRIEPPPSLACANGTTRAATKAAAPPDDPPGIRVRSQGLCVGPFDNGSVDEIRPASGVADFPSETRPAPRHLLANGLSLVATRPASPRLPASVGAPFQSIRSLMKVGTPANAPDSSPAASDRADSNVSVTIPLTCGSTALARFIAASTCSSAVVSPAAIPAAIATPSA
jgi:hypothetical protein